MAPRRTEAKPRPKIHKTGARILVVTEGRITEPQYVEALNSYLRSATTHVKTAPVGSEPLTVVKKCMEHQAKDVARGTEYDHYVCLVDVDEHDKLQAACELAARQKIDVVICNLKVEVWLRWHKEDKRGALTSKQLDALMKNLGLMRAEKHLASDFPIDGVDQACRIAYQVDQKLATRRIGPDPSSAMPFLVDLMRG